MIQEVKGLRKQNVYSLGVQAPVFCNQHLIQRRKQMNTRHIISNQGINCKGAFQRKETTILSMEFWIQKSRRNKIVYLGPGILEGSSMQLAVISTVESHILCRSLPCAGLDELCVCYEDPQLGCSQMGASFERHRLGMRQ